jgi:hypothetical protein
MKSTPILALLLAVAPFVSAQQLSPELQAKPAKGVKKLAPPLPIEPQEDMLLQVDVKARYLDLEAASSFVIQAGSQANQVSGGDKAFTVTNKAGTGLEYKKWGFIVNLLPVVHPNKKDTIRAELQVELSGPVKSAAKLEGSTVTDVSTWQLQTSTEFLLGKPTVISKGPAMVEVTINQVQP